MGFALMVVAALLANATCYGFCATAACSSGQPPANSCHHHKPQKDNAGCQHQHSVFTGVEADAAKTGVTAVSIQPGLTARPVAYVPELQISQRPNSDPPPGHHVTYTISILRI